MPSHSPKPDCSLSHGFFGTASPGTTTTRPRADRTRTGGNSPRHGAKEGSGEDAAQLREVFLYKKAFLFCNTLGEVRWCHVNSSSKVQASVEFRALSGRCPRHTVSSTEPSSGFFFSARSMFLAMKAWLGRRTWSHGWFGASFGAARRRSRLRPKGCVKLVVNGFLAVMMGSLANLKQLGVSEAEHSGVACDMRQFFDRVDGVSLGD